MIYDNFKISDTGEPLLDINDLLRVQLDNDNLQGFQVGRRYIGKVVQEAAPFLRGIETSHGFDTKDTVPQRRSVQLFTIERNGLPSCRAENKGQQYVCPQRRQVSSRSSSVDRTPKRKFQRQCAGNDQRSKTWIL